LPKKKRHSSSLKDLIKGVAVFLQDVEAKSMLDLSNPPKSIDHTLNYDYKIVNVENNQVNIKLVINIESIPENLFKIKLEVIGKYLFKEAINEEMVLNDVPFLLDALAPEVSYIVSFLTDRMLKQPYIIPPIISLELDVPKDTKKKNTKAPHLA